MGLSLWIFAGMITFTLTRFIETARGRWFSELSISLITALAAGLAATAMDFGGWAVADGRSFAFAGLASLLGVGVARVKKNSRD